VQAAAQEGEDLAAGGSGGGYQAGAVKLASRRIARRQVSAVTPALITLIVPAAPDCMPTAVQPGIAASRVVP